MAKRPRRIWGGIKPQESIKPIDPVVDDTTWRDRIKKLNCIKFDDNAKLKFLKTLEETGKIGLACQAAGISTGTWRGHAEREPDFYDAVKHTVEVFNARRAATLEQQAMKGFREVVFGPNGERAYRRRYETQLRVMVLRAADKEMYDETNNVNVNVNAGAFLVPATLNPDDWAKQFEEMQSRFIPDTNNPQHAILTEGHAVKQGDNQPMHRPRENE